MEAITVDVVLEKLGGPVMAARELGVARTTVLGWRKDQMIPASRLVAIHNLTKIDISVLALLVPAPGHTTSAAA